MRNILVLGGTRFFGQRLVDTLVTNKDRVTVASHNFSKTNFGPHITRLQVEREIPESLELLKNTALTISFMTKFAILQVLLAIW